MQLSDLPFPQLRQLRLKGIEVQLEPTWDSLGVLHHCTGLTALELQGCRVRDARAAFAAIAALTGLQRLVLEWTRGGLHLFWSQLQLPSQLTYLSLDNPDNEEAQRLNQLSSLVDLQHLKLAGMSWFGLPGGLPSQLAKLTCLRVLRRDICSAHPSQFQHLSSLTALQELELNGGATANRMYLTGDVSGPDHIQHLRQLTSLRLSELDASNTHKWTHLTALQRLALVQCLVQPDAVAALTQLTALSCCDITVAAGAPCADILRAVAQLPRLAELFCKVIYKRGSPALTASAFTELQPSTRLRSLQLYISDVAAPEGWVMFGPGFTYPFLSSIDLQRVVPVSEQQFQQQCSCCPAVESLSVSLCISSPSVLLPVLQLSALTSLHMATLQGAAAAAAATVGVLQRS
jgi:hypothetical protein